MKRFFRRPTMVADIFEEFLPKSQSNKIISHNLLVAEFPNAE